MNVHCIHRFVQTSELHSVSRSNTSVSPQPRSGTSPSQFGCFAAGAQLLATSAAATLGGTAPRFASPTDSASPLASHPSTRSFAADVLRFASSSWAKHSGSLLRRSSVCARISNCGHTSVHQSFGCSLCGALPLEVAYGDLSTWTQIWLVSKLRTKRLEMHMFSECDKLPFVRFVPRVARLLCAQPKLPTTTCLRAQRDTRALRLQPLVHRILHLMGFCISRDTESNLPTTSVCNK